MSEMKIDGAVIYTDGSCIPNPGFGGWGFHGYLYSSESPKKGSGNATQYISNMGYVEKKLRDEFHAKRNPFSTLDAYSSPDMREDVVEILTSQADSVDVTPLFYVDCFGPNVGHGIDSDPTTNNIGEVMAIVRALEYCLEEDIQNVQIFADSEYALLGMNKALPIWAKNHWRKRDGEVIKNASLWQRAWDLQQQMLDRNITYNWLKGHSFFFGNNLADTNASLGRCMTVASLSDFHKVVSPATGYWKVADADRHPFINHQKLFFNGDSDFHEKGVYHMGAVDADIGLLGKRLSDSAYSVAHLKEPIASLELLIQHHCQNGGDRNEIVVANLANFFRASTFKQFTEYGTFCLNPKFEFENSLYAVNGDVVTEVSDPPKKSMEAILAVNNLQQWMKDWIEKAPGSERFTATDLTEHLYESSVVIKKKKEVSVSKLLASIKPGLASIEVEAKYRTTSGEELTLPTILSFGIDTPDRLGLKRIEELNPTITLLTWEESPGVFRYFTIAEAGEDIAAYCGYYSNIRLNKAKKPKKAK